MGNTKEILDHKEAAKILGPIIGGKPIVKVKLLDKKAKLPERAKEGDACYDVVATSKEVILPGVIKYGLGFAVELPWNSQLDIRPRSSIYKTGLILANSIGTVDEGYRGEISLVFYKVAKDLPDYEIGERIAQIQVKTRCDVEFKVALELSTSERGEGGFGSSGK